MSYNNDSGSTQQTQSTPKDNRKLIYGVLIALLLGTWAFLIYDKTKSKQEMAQQQFAFNTVDSARLALKEEYDNTLQRMDSLTGTNVQLQGDLAGRKSEIDKLRNEIKNILTQKNGDLATAKAKIAELNGKVNDLVAEVEKLRGENQQLATNNEQLTTEKQTLTTQKEELQQTLTVTKSEKERLADVGSTLHASNFNITALNVKRNGKEKETTSAKKADMLRISFELDENRIAPGGAKELYVCVTGPDGKPVHITNNGTFKTRDDGDKAFTNKVQLQYEQGKRTPVSFDWKQDGIYQTGNYKIEIYQNGYKIGEGNKTLRKGGIFG